MGTCTERTVIDRRKGVVSTNAIYRCEELEDAASMYDDIQEDQYNDLNYNTAYLELISDTVSESPLPRPRPVTESQDQNQNQDRKGLNEKKPDQINLQMLKDETEGIDHDTEAPNEDEDHKDEDHDTEPQEQDQQTKSKDQDQDTDIQNQTHDQDTKSQNQDHVYKGLKKEQPGYIYRLMDGTEGTDKDTGVPEQDQYHITKHQEQDQQTESKQQDPDKNNQYQTHDQDTEFDRDHDYERLKEEQPGHIYDHVLTDETEGNDQDTGVPD